MGIGNRKVAFFSCSVSEPVTCASVGGLGVGVGEGGGVGILPGLILNGVDAVGEQEGWLWFVPGGFVPTVGDSMVVVSDVPGVEGSWMWS